MRLDNTQYTAFSKCPLYWYEKYVNKVHRPVEGQRQDALAIGIHVHNALENGYRRNSFRVDEATSVEYPLTPEAALEVRTMIEYYRQQYPGGPIELPWTGLETPLEYVYSDDLTLVAKVDGYSTNDKPINIPDGMGDSIHLEPGVYGFETKTKAPYLDRGLYMKEWGAAMQGSFQLLCLKKQVDNTRIRGIIINVIERPKIYTPRKTCKGCNELLPLYTYTIEPNGVYRCNSCNHSNKFPGPFPEPRVDPPFTWRFLIERSEERLLIDLETIKTVAKLMNSNIIHTHRHECVSTYNKRTCEYYEPHNAASPVMAIDFDGFKIFNPTKYLEPKEEQ